MAKGTAKSLGPVAESESIRDAENLMDPASWEARLAKARIQREKVLSKRKPGQSPSPSSLEKAPKSDVPPPQNSPSVESATAAASQTERDAPEAPKPTVSWNDRVAQAVEQRKIVMAQRAKNAPPPQRPAPGSNPVPYKDTVRLAMSGRVVEKPAVVSDQKDATPKPVVAAQPTEKKSRTLRVLTVSVALVIGVGAGLALRDPLLKTSRWAVETTTAFLSQPVSEPANVPENPPTGTAPKPDPQLAVTVPPQVTTPNEIVASAPVVFPDDLAGLDLGAASMERTGNEPVVFSSEMFENVELRIIANAMSPPTISVPGIGAIPVVSTASYPNMTVARIEQTAEESDVAFQLISSATALTQAPIQPAQTVPVPALSTLAVAPNNFVRNSEVDDTIAINRKSNLRIPKSLPAPSLISDQASLNRDSGSISNAIIPSVQTFAASEFAAPAARDLAPHLGTALTTGIWAPNPTPPGYPVTQNVPAIDPISRPDPTTPVLLASLQSDQVTLTSPDETDISLILLALPFERVKRTQAAEPFPVPKSEIQAIAPQIAPTPPLAPTTHPRVRPEGIAPETASVVPEIENLATLSNYTIFLNAPESLAESKLNAFAAALSETGYPVKAPKRVGFKISKSNVRFFHAQDSEAAQLLAAAVGGKVRDFTTFQPSPEVGTIEIWLAGEAPKSKPIKKKRVAKRTPKEDPALTALRAKLLNSLKRGDHLE